MHQKYDDPPIKGRFRVIECLGREQLTECQRCGYEFITNDAGTKNSVFDWAKMDNVPVCPLCNTEGS